jgi:lysine 2,3-aminomutase
MIHVNHADEIDSNVEESLVKLKTTGINIFSQTVLLKDINDTKKSLIDLFLKLGEIGIIPYYLHHPDQTTGTKHFQLKLESGRKIYRSLQNDLPGWLIPKYIYDIPNGEGKTSAFNPESDQFSGSMISMNGLKIKIEEEIK